MTRSSRLLQVGIHKVGSLTFFSLWFHPLPMLLQNFLYLVRRDFSVLRRFSRLLFRLEGLWGDLFGFVRHHCEKVGSLPASPA